MHPLDSYCPRIARAISQRRIIEPEFHRARVQAELFVLEEERVLAHRELQIIRAGVARTTRMKYLKERQRKLEEAERRVARAKNRVPSWEDYNRAS